MTSHHTDRRRLPPRPGSRAEAPPISGSLELSVRERLRAAPPNPGAYAFLDSEGGVIYVGKASNLRRRLAQYARGPSAQPDHHVRLLMSALADVRWFVTATELHALLLEDELIKAWWPPYNRRQKRLLRYCQLSFTADPFPRLIVCGIPRQGDPAAPPSGAAFGPFPDARRAELLRDLVNEELGLRSCHRSEPDRTCIRVALGTCSAPCQGEISPAEYRKIVTVAASLFSGDAGELLERLRERMQRQSDALAFEQAARTRDVLVFFEHYLARARFLAQFCGGRTLVWGMAPRDHCWLFERGEPIASWARRSDDEDEATARHLLSAAPPNPADPTRLDARSYDRALVLLSWLAADRARRCFRSL